MAVLTRWINLAMGEARTPDKVMMVLAAFSQDEAALEWSLQRAEAAWGKTALRSPVFQFTETDYYTPSMGSPLLKSLWAFERPANAEELAAWKHQTNSWEIEFAQTNAGNVVRPLNLDPGYLTLGKLVLASTKDHAHRIYLRRGIYAEVTLGYRKRRWHHWEWTYPDYRRQDVQGFLDECRDYLQRILLPASLR